VCTENIGISDSNAKFVGYAPRNRFNSKSEAIKHYFDRLSVSLDAQNDVIDTITELEAIPDDTFDAGSVVVFDHVVQHTAAALAPTMTTDVAIKGLDGYWYTTHMGPTSWWCIVTEAHRNKVYAVEEAFLVENDE